MLHNYDIAFCSNKRNISIAIIEACCFFVYILITRSGGRRAQLLELVIGPTSIGLSGLSLETNPDPDTALFDGQALLSFKYVELVLKQLKNLDKLIQLVLISISSNYIF